MTLLAALQRARVEEWTNCSDCNSLMSSPGDVSRVCDICCAAPSKVYCAADKAKLCLACDTEVCEVDSV